MEDPNRAPLKARTEEHRAVVGGGLGALMGGLGALMGGLGLLLMGIAMLWGVGWASLSEPKTKLYESDNVVCSIGPLVQDCFERKPR